MQYRIDPELVPWLSMLPQGSRMSDPVAGRTALHEDLAFLPPYEPTVPLHTEDRVIPGYSDSPDVNVRVYAPTDIRTPHPALLNIHGGGFVIGNLALDDASCLRTASELGITVISVDYRLAPENPYPAGLEDCYSALTWLATNADSLGIDPSRIGVAGESAGGGLAAALALLARDRSGPALCFQYLGIPELDDRLSTKSMTSFVDTPLWTRSDAVLSWQHYLGGRDADQYASPARATDLSSLPSAYVSVAEFDPLRDEGIAYATALVQAGVGTELHIFPGTFHGSYHVVPGAEISLRWTAEKLTVLRRGLAC